MELFRLFGSILIDDQDAIASLNKVDKKGQDTQSKLEGLVTKGAKIGAAITAGTTVAVGGLMALANTTSETAATWKELSQRTNIGVENLQKWGFAADQSGADIEKLQTGMKTLSDSMVSAVNGSASAQSAYQQLGISMSELSSMTPEQAFERVMYALGDMEDGALKNSIGNDLLGKSYTELKPLLDEGSSGMEALKKQAEDLGIVMSEDSVNAAEGYGDKLDQLKATFDGVKNKIVGDLIPVLNNILDWVLNHMPEIQATAGGVFNFIGGTIGFISDNANIVIPILGALLTAFLAFKVLTTVNSLIAAFNVVMDANPIGLIILAIAALITLIVLLATHFDEVKTTTLAVFASIHEAISGAVDKIKSVFDTVFDILMTPFRLAKAGIEEVINKIKGFLDFKWEFPKLKLPHFKVDGSMNPMNWFDDGIPKISVDWYAKGGIFSKPTIFNTPYGLKGVGEAGPEVVAPISELQNMLGSNGTTVEVNLNIENFYNNDETDVENLGEQLGFAAQRKLEAVGQSA